VIIKLVFFLLLILVTSPAYSDGGISALDGLGEGLTFLGMAILTLSAWLTFVVIVIIKKKVTHKVVRNFRLTIVTLILCLYLIMVFLALIAFSFAWEIMLVVVPFSIIMIGLTELVIFINRKNHN
jgi:hypothetical protein